LTHLLWLVPKITDKRPTVFADSSIGVDFFTTVRTIICKGNSSWVDSIWTIGAAYNLLSGTGYFNGQNDKKN